MACSFEDSSSMCSHGHLAFSRADLAEVCLLPESLLSYWDWCCQGKDKATAPDQWCLSLWNKHWHQCWIAELLEHLSRFLEDCLLAQKGLWSQVTAIWHAHVGLTCTLQGTKALEFPWSIALKQSATAPVGCCSPWHTWQWPGLPLQGSHSASCLRKSTEWTLNLRWN